MTAGIVNASHQPWLDFLISKISGGILFLHLILRIVRLAKGIDVAPWHLVFEHDNSSIKCTAPRHT